MTSLPKYQDSESVQSLTAGDRQGFAAAYDSYYLSVYHYSKKFLENSQQAEDITADSFIKLWKHAADIQNVKAFLFTTAKNACLDHLKLSRLHAVKEKEITFLAEQDSKTEIAVAEIRAEVLQYVYAEIEKLPKKCREIFKLSYIEGLKVSEVAEHLHLSEQTVSNQKTIALRKLKLALGDRQWMLLCILIEYLD